jgi:hypothetical protein
MSRNAKGEKKKWGKGQIGEKKNCRSIFVHAALTIMGICNVRE